MLACLTLVLVCLTLAKLQKLVCARSVAHDFGMHGIANTHDTQEMHVMSLHLVFPHYMCGVTTGIVAVGNEIQLFCS